MATEQTLDQRYQQIRNHYSAYTEHTPLASDHEFVKAGLIWGENQGNQTPRILLIALEPSNWKYSKEDQLDLLAYDLLASVNGDEWPIFAHLQDDKSTAHFSLFGGAGTHSVDSIPSVDLILDHLQLEKDPTFRWSMMTYTQLMKQLNIFHERVHRIDKDRGIGNKNDIISEVSKILFLETFRVRHDPTLTFKFEGKTLVFREIFDFNYVAKHGELAVEQIKAAFAEYRDHPDYVITLEDGTHEAIFVGKNKDLYLSNPKNFVTLLRIFQDLGPVKDNRSQIVKQAGSLADMPADLLGRVFDVFLRTNFESKGGLGQYLTPNPVKQAMLEIAMHDIANDNPIMERITSNQFRYCDPTCGSYGFGSVALSHLKRLINYQVAGVSNTQKKKIIDGLLLNSFVGSDSAENMVTLARVNMALQGAPKAKIFWANSLTTKLLKPNSFDLICTNPPFGTPKFGPKDAEAKKHYEAEMEQVLGGFRPTEKVVDSYNAYYDYLKMKWEDTGDLYLDDDGTPKWPGYRTDLRNVSNGKKPEYRLYPSTSGLALGSKPDGKGIWKPVGATIDPAVLFIDRCLQLLRPGGRLLIVLPDGVLCNSGDRYVREYIMGKKDEKTGQFVGGKAIVKAVLSLPADTFKLSGTGAKTSVLYLQKRNTSKERPEQFLPDPQGDVFMAVAETLGYVVKNNIEDYSAGVPNDLDKIVGAYKRGE
ncbi:MAG: N-6 DNA methylase [Methylococcales bacterium]|nr:N-6 DNA methylase [Methylococcales bacterium]